MLELNGGNDGLNTVVPYTDDLYYRSRPTLALPANTLHRIDDRVGFAAPLSGFNALLQDDALAVVQNVGYPNPSRSHFDSMMIWQTANLDGSRDITRPAESAGLLAH